MVKFRFEVGRVVATPAALTAIESVGGEVFDLLLRHGAGEWGDVCAEDAEENDRALRLGNRILSSYTVGEGDVAVKVWIVTEGHRSATTVLLPEEY